MSERIFSSPPRPLVISSAMFFLCLLALFMTGSRAAAALSLAALLLAFILFFWRHLSTRIGISVALCSGCLVSFVLLELMGGNVRAGFDARGYSDEARVQIYRSVLEMIAEHPWFGTGQGTFAYAYPAYRSMQSSMSGVLEMAHSTILEIASDMGIPIAVLVVISWIVILAVLHHGALVRRRNRIMPVAAIAVATLALAHSLIDFSLQIPGYSIVALSLIGAGLAQSFSHEIRIHSRAVRSP
jgi:O-antigen ligase